MSQFDRKAALVAALAKPETEVLSVAQEDEEYTAMYSDGSYTVERIIDVRIKVQAKSPPRKME